MSTAKYVSTVGLAKNAAEALGRYRRLRENNLLTQDTHNRPGLTGAGKMGILGAATWGGWRPVDCPEWIMPLWMAQAVYPLFHNGPPSECFPWGELVYVELARLDGKVPDSVRRRWIAYDLLPVQKLRLEGPWIDEVTPVIDEASKDLADDHDLLSAFRRVAEVRNKVSDVQQYADHRDMRAGYAWAACADTAEILSESLDIGRVLTRTLDAAHDAGISGLIWGLSRAGLLTRLREAK